ncbi:hypothetical protein RYA05_00580 [Pseudomonas syringae pv. actinidiae]|nr:hypothetical protein [Pseudomonas syringae pv. actinidiae]
MSKQNSRWVYIDIFSLLRRKTEGTLDEKGARILDEWCALPFQDRIVMRPHLCGEKIRFKQPSRGATPQEMPY